MLGYSRTFFHYFGRFSLTLLASSYVLRIHCVYSLKKHRVYVEYLIM